MAINESLLFKVGMDGSRIAQVVNESVKGLERLGREIKNVNTRIASVDKKVEKAAKRTSTHLGRIGSELQTVGMYLRTYIAYRGISAFNQLNEVIKEYDKWLHQSVTLLDDAAGGYKDLDKVVSGVAVTIGEDLPTAAKAAYQALSAGIEKSKLDEFLKATGEAALAGAGDMESTARVLSMLMNVYGDQVKNVRDISDMLFITIKKGVTTLPELAQHLGSVASIARQAGIRLDDLLVTLAGLTKAGIRTPIAVTAIRSALTQMLKPNEALKATLDDLRQAVERFDDLPLVERLRLISQAVGGSAEAISKLFPNVRGLNAVMAALNDNADVFNRIAVDMTQRVGATTSAADEMRNSFDFMTRQLKTEFFTLLRDMAQTYLPAVIGSLREMVGILEEMSTNGDLKGLSELIRGIVQDMLGLATLLLRTFSFAPSLNKWLVYLFVFRKSVFSLSRALVSLGARVLEAVGTMRTFSVALTTIVGSEVLAKLSSMAASFSKIGAALLKLTPLMAIIAGTVYIGHKASEAIEALGDQMQDVGIATVGAADSIGDLRQRLAELGKEKAALEARRSEYGLTEQQAERYAKVTAEYDRTKKILDALISREERRRALIKKQQKAEEDITKELERQKKVREQRQLLLMWRRYHQDAMKQAQDLFKYYKQQQKGVYEQYQQIQKKIESLRKRHASITKRIEDAVFNYRFQKIKKTLEAREKAIKDELQKRKDAIEEARRAEADAAKKVDELHKQFRWTRAKDFRKELRERFKEEQKRQELLEKMKKRVAAKIQRGVKHLKPEELFIKQILDAEKQLAQAVKQRKKVEKANSIDTLIAKLKEIQDKQAKLQEIAEKRADLRQREAIKEMMVERAELSKNLNTMNGTMAGLLTKAGEIHSILSGLRDEIAAYAKAIENYTSELKVLQ